MNKIVQCAVILLSLGGAAVMPAAEPAPPANPAGASAPTKPASGAPAPTAPANVTPTAPAGAKSPATAPAAQSAEPDRIEPTEKVRADSEVSFPVDI